MTRLLMMLCCWTLLACGGREHPPGELDGEALYQQNCSQCHGSYGEGSNLGPDLVWGVGEQTHEEVVDTILAGADGMEALDLTLASANAVATFVIEEIRGEW